MKIRSPIVILLALALFVSFQFFPGQLLSSHFYSSRFVPFQAVSSQSGAHIVQAADPEPGMGPGNEPVSASLTDEVNSDENSSDEINPDEIHLVEISPHLQEELAAAQGPISFLAILTEQPDSATVAESAMLAVQATDQVTTSAGVERRAAIYRYLTAEAARSQASLRAWLDENEISYRSYYLVNMLEIEGDASTVQALRTRPELARLVANPFIDEAGNRRDSDAFDTLDAFHEGIVTLDPDEPSATGIEYTRAPAVWELGFRGQGIVVASGDTGVQWDHPGLIAKYRGWDRERETVSHDYHWLDAWRAEDQENNAPTQCANVTGACDDWGHGTHTLGTMVADPAPNDPRPIGMAPDAQWIACRNMRANFGTPAKYTECFQFFLAPYPQGGDPFTDGDPALGADIVNNSWGCPPDEGCDAASLREVVEMVRAAGMFVVASAGNSGAGGCGTVQTPPAHHAATFTVGAHQLTGTIASFSSRGPVTVDGSRRLKPDLVAPGVGIYSTYRDSGYAGLSGTSMAAPHIAGAVALLWSAVAELRGDVTLTEEILRKSATPVLNNTCDAGQPAIAPNNTYGYGRLDAYRAVQMALTPWAVGVRVLAPGGAPLDQVEVELRDELTGLSQRATTDADGWARWSSLYQGTYECRIYMPSEAVGGTGISLLPAPMDPDREIEQGSITVGSCRVQDVVEPSASRLYAPALERNEE